MFRKLFNYLLVELQIGLGRRRLVGKPYWLTVDPSSFCQLKCPFCPTGAERNVRPKAMLPMEHFQHILRVLGPTLIHIDFMNWGEPLLNKGIYEMIALAKSYPRQHHGLDEFQRLQRGGRGKDGPFGARPADPLDRRPRPGTYEKYRVGGDYEKVVRHLKLPGPKAAGARAQKPADRLAVPGL